LLSFVAAVPMAGMAATIAWQEFQSIARGSQERAALLDGQSLTQFNTAFARATGRLSSDLRLASGGICDTSLQPALVGQGIAGLMTVDTDGRTVCQLGDVPPMQPRPWPWYDRVRAGEPAVLDAIGETQVPAVAMRAPTGEVVTAFMPLDWFALRSLPEPVRHTDATWLMDANRHVLASRGDATDALPDLPTMIHLVSSSQLALRAVSAHGLRYAYATTLLPGGWRLIAATSAQLELQLAVRRLLFRMVELAVLWVAGLTAVVMGADVAFGNPLRRLSQAVRRWQGGAVFDPGNLAGAPDEVLELAQSFKDATAVLREKEAELVRSQEQQNLLVLEIHHRVKNNLQVIASLLNLQASRIRVPEARAEFQAARDRVRALATLHRHLYADGGLHTINMRSFLTELCGQLFQAMGEKEGDRIKLSIEAPELRMSSDQAVPLALIVTEAVTNSVKYAFPGGRSGHVSVSLRERDGLLDLVISDDGIGIPAGKSETESGTRDGIGLQLIRGFARQLGASLQVEQGVGTRYAVRLSPQLPVAGEPRRVDLRVPERDNVA
jgi:two-component sensor histidine kinase